MKRQAILKTCCTILLIGTALIASAGDGSSVLDNRGLITYYGYVRGERIRQEVQELERQRQQNREALHQAQSELDRLDRALQGYPLGRVVPGIRAADESAPGRLRAATFGRRAPYYSF